jgi:hypothetical protein
MFFLLFACYILLLSLKLCTYTLMLCGSALSSIQNSYVMTRHIFGSSSSFTHPCDDTSSHDILNQKNENVCKVLHKCMFMLVIPYHTHSNSEKHQHLFHVLIASLLIITTLTSWRFAF